MTLALYFLFLDAKFLTIHDGVCETDREVLRTKQPSNCLPPCPPVTRLHVVDARQAYHRAIIRRVLREGGAHEQPPGRATDDSEVRPPACKYLLKGGPGGSR